MSVAHSLGRMPTCSAARALPSSLSGPSPASIAAASRRASPGDHSRPASSPPSSSPPSPRAMLPGLGVPVARSLSLGVALGRSPRRRGAEDLELLLRCEGLSHSLCLHGPVDECDERLEVLHLPNQQLALARQVGTRIGLGVV